MIYVGIANMLLMLRIAVMGRTTLKALSYYIVLTGLFLFSAFRFDVGCDWTGYAFQYQNSELIVFSLLQGEDIREPVWNLMVLGIKYLGLPYPVLNVVSSFFFFWGIHVLGKHQPDRLAFLVVLFPVLIVNMPMSGIRQGVAIGLICIAISAYLRGKPWRFAGWVLFAWTFHSSAILALGFLPFMIKGSRNRKVMLLTFAGLPALYLLATSSAVQIAITRYITTDIGAAGAIYRIGILLVTAVYFLGLLRPAWKRQFPADYSLALTGALTMIVVFVFLPVSMVMADRIGYYLIPIQAMIFARVPYLNLGSTRMVQTVLPYAALMLFFAVWAMLSYHFKECYLPYRTWLFGYPEGWGTQY